VIYDDKGEVRVIYPPGSEGYDNYYRGLEILERMYRKYWANIENKERKRGEKVAHVLDKPDKKVIRRAEQRKLKSYNLSQTAMILNVPRQTLYYWIKKRWITPKRDYRNYPFFTVFDIERLIKERHTVPSA